MLFCMSLHAREILFRLVDHLVDLVLHQGDHYDRDDRAQHDPKDLVVVLRHTVHFLDGIQIIIGIKTEQRAANIAVKQHQQHRQHGRNARDLALLLHRLTGNPGPPHAVNATGDNRQQYNAYNTSFRQHPKHLTFTSSV